jgi:hypothetical protein
MSSVVVTGAVTVTSIGGPVTPPTVADTVVLPGFRNSIAAVLPSGDGATATMLESAATHFALAAGCGVSLPCLSRGV